MTRTKWLRPLALLAALVLVLGACGGRGDDDDDTSSTTAPAGEGEGGEDEGEEEPPGDPQPGPGFDGETIRIGVLTPTSGSVAIIGEPLTAGNQAYVDYVNEELGGIGGRYQLELVIEDSAYNPTQAGQRYTAIRDDVAMFVQILGTPVVNALLPDLMDDGIIAGPASLDSAWVREPNLMPVGGPYQIQAINGIDWYYGQPENEGQLLCTLASDDEYGDTGVEGVEFAADQLGIEVAVRATFPAPSAERPPQNFESQISQLQGAGCEVVFFVATPSDTGPFATAMAENAAFNPTVIGQSPTWLGLYAAHPFLLEHFYLTSEGADWGDESVPGMAELMRIRETYAADQAPDIYFNFGYLQAMAMVQILEEAVANGDLSRDGILAASESVGTLTFDGLTGDYVYGAAADRVPPIVSSIFRPDPESPTGLTIVEQDHEAPYAGEFSFD